MAEQPGPDIRTITSSNPTEVTMPEDGHEFRFVIAGTKLSAEHQQHIATAVARAGAEALASIEFEQPQSAVNFIPRRWLGIWVEVLSEERAGQIANTLGIERQVGIER